MTDATTIAASADLPDPDADDRRAVGEADRLAASIARAERRLGLLAKLADIGMDLAGMLHERARADHAAAGAKTQPCDPHPDPAGAFAKLSRAVRLTLDLEAKADEALRALVAGEVKIHAERRQAGERLAGQAERQRCDDATSRVAIQVGVAIAAETESEFDSVQRHAALDERLAFDEAYEDLADRPLREVVERLCADLGLSPDWSGWTDEGWPQSPPVGPDARGRFSPFHQPSPRPILWRNQVDDRTLRFFELAARSP